MGIVIGEVPLTPYPDAYNAGAGNWRVCGGGGGPHIPGHRPTSEARNGASELPMS